MGSIADKSLNDVAANTERVASEATDAVVDVAADAAAKVTNLSPNVKLLLAAAGAVVASTLVNQLISRQRAVRVTNKFVVPEVIEVDESLETSAHGL